jgi:anaerobic selenocysteine-containing dehydrogenase
MSPAVSRRNFLRLGGASVAAAVLAGCQRPRRWVALEPYVRPPEEQLAGVATWYASTCRQCPAGCGIVVRVMNGRALKIEGNPDHPLNRGKLCARGQSGLQLLYNPDRLPGPMQQAERGSRQFERMSWSGALNALYEGMGQAGPRIAVWGDTTMSGHLYSIFQRLADAIGGPAPVIFDPYSTFAGYDALRSSSQALFGQDALPVYDLSQADVVFSFGAHFLADWLSPVHYGVSFGAFRGQALGKRGYLVQFEPRMAITGAKADRWVPIKPGSEALIAAALLRLIADQGVGPSDRVARARELAGDIDIAHAASESDLPVGELQRLAQVFANAARPLALPGGALAGRDHAADAMATVQALNLAAGVGGQPGGLSLTPAPPLPTLARPAAVPFAQAQDLIEQMRGDQVQVLLVHGGNPAYGLPEGSGFVEALEHVPLVVSFSPIVDETAVYADLLLPDRTYLESWGYEVVSPSPNRPIVGAQQPVVTPVFDARSTADVLLTVARGIAAAANALPWSDEVDLLKDSIRPLPPGAFGGSGQEVLWSRFLQHGGWWPAASSPPMLPTPIQLRPIAVTAPQRPSDQGEFPYYLNLYLSPELSDGRGANQPWLQGSPDPMTTVAWQTWVEIHPKTAAELGVQEDDVVHLVSPYGELEAPVYTYPGIRPDTVAVPLGQGHSDYGRYARNRGSNPLRLVGIQQGAEGNELHWDTVRVKVVPTGRRVALALFENKGGVTEGFINERNPG